jgi:predicted N-acetyltransferase YhbS
LISLCIRTLEESDLESADEILKLAFRGAVSRLEDLRLYRQIQPDGWFVAEKAERLVGMVGAANYGKLAHIGLMAVHPEAQRQGIGLALMQFLLDRLGRQQIPLVTLDASQMGRPLYDRLGFIPYDETITFQRLAPLSVVPQPSGIQPITMVDLDELVEKDTQVFGADRRKVFQVLLENFPDRGFLQRDENGKLVGYLFAQKNRIGPWVMLKPGRAEALFQAALSLGDKWMLSLTVPSVNAEAMDLLKQYGFTQVRSNRHMGRGNCGLPGQREKVYSQTSLAVG